MNRRTFLWSTAAVGSGIGVAALYWPRRWNYIVIHHSGGEYGNIRFLRKVHRERQKNDPVDAIPYHYIVGNGNGMAEGEIASDWRNEYMLWGAHLSSRNTYKNFTGIGICLIGNFERHEVPEKQFLVVVSLTKSLILKYDIPYQNVSGHGHTKGEHTRCPGKNFPMQRFLSEIQKA
jgi:N-acetyl-anhydromuramyl-L-alanine amidase AmpD